MTFWKTPLQEPLFNKVASLQQSNGFDIRIVVLTHFMPLISFDTPQKHQKTRGFLMFSGVIKGVSGMKWVK